MLSSVVNMQATVSSSPPMVNKRFAQSAPSYRKATIALDGNNFHHLFCSCAGVGRVCVPSFRFGASHQITVPAMDMDDEVAGGGPKLDPNPMPKHIAVILDGNGRWAEQRGLTTGQGHRAGAANLEKLVLTAASKFQIKVLTVYAFSTENWSRSQMEIDLLMTIFDDFIQSFVTELIIRHGLQFSVIGDKVRLPASLQSTISRAEESSRGNRGMHFVMALSYSGRLDITEACKKIIRKVQDGIFGAKDINDEVVEQHLMTSCIQGFPCPDLLIRTSGELRLSNFLLWQLAYTEFYFTDKLFPDFDEADFMEALSSFQARKRSYGGRPHDTRAINSHLLIID